MEYSFPKIACASDFFLRTHHFSGDPMHALSVLHKLLARAVPIHATHLDAIIAAVQALTRGANASVTSLGRHIVGSTYDKHKIKRIDRLLSNPHLYHLYFANIQIISFNYSNLTSFSGDRVKYPGWDGLGCAHSRTGLFL